MKFILLLVLTMVNPDTHELQIQYKQVDNPAKCVMMAEEINKQLVANKAPNAYASCVINFVGEQT